MFATLIAVTSGPSYSRVPGMRLRRAWDLTGVLYDIRQQGGTPAAPVNQPFTFG
jgi:hypothetical protein